MAALLPSAELQFCDANGNPYAGGTVMTYVPGTTTPAPTWVESTGTVLNTNPIVLDSAGRCIIWGSGAYRMVLADALGNLIFDQVTSSYVSAAMAPVCLAPDIPTAVGLLGIGPLIAAATANEAALRTAADAVVAGNASTALTTFEASYATQRNTDLATLNGSIAAETARAEAAEAAIIATAVKFGAGGPTDGSGHFRVTYPVAFATVTVSFVAMVSASGIGNVILNGIVDRFGADVWASSAGANPAVGVNFFYVAGGN